MNNNSSKIVTLIPSATEIVAFLDPKNSIVGRSHECDYPHGLSHIAKLTSLKINVDGNSGEIESLEIFAEIINPSFFNFNHEGTGWINYND